jgi:hypothetical protein
MVAPRSRRSNPNGTPLTVWTAHLPEDKRAEFSQQMALMNGPVLKRLLDIVQKYKSVSQDRTLSKSNYESPSWAYIQADNVGYQRALTEIELLLKGIVK